MIDKKRNSNIELLKLISMMMICISHSTAYYVPNYDPLSDAYINLNHATTNPQIFILIIFYYLGQIGNAIFLTCSAFFLLENDKINAKKIVTIVIDTVFIAWGWFFATYANGFEITRGDIIRTIFPISSGNNWFVGCYIMLYLIHPALNWIIRKLTSSQMFWCVVVLLLMYGSPLHFFGITEYYYSKFVGCVVVYFVIGYCKFAKEHVLNKNCKQILMCSSISVVLLVFLTNTVGLAVEALYDNQLMWAEFQNPLIIGIAISSFYLFYSKRNKYNKLINCLSSVTLLIYIIHEDIFFRNTLKPLFWIGVYNELSYKNVVLITVLFSVMCFCLSCVIAVIYNNTVGKILHKIIWKIVLSVKNVIVKLANHLI